MNVLAYVCTPHGAILQIGYLQLGVLAADSNLSDLFEEDSELSVKRNLLAARVKRLRDGVRVLDAALKGKVEASADGSVTRPIKRSGIGA